MILELANSFNKFIDDTQIKNEYYTELAGQGLLQLLTDLSGTQLRFPAPKNSTKITVRIRRKSMQSLILAKFRHEQPMTIRSSETCTSLVLSDRGYVSVYYVFLDERLYPFSCTGLDIEGVFRPYFDKDIVRYKPTPKRTSSDKLVLPLVLNK